LVAALISTAAEATTIAVVRVNHVIAYVVAIIVVVAAAADLLTLTVFIVFIVTVFLFLKESTRHIERMLGDFTVIFLFVRNM